MSITSIANLPMRKEAKNIFVVLIYCQAAPKYKVTFHLRLDHTCPEPEHRASEGRRLSVRGDE